MKSVLNERTTSVGAGVSTDVLSEEHDMESRRHDATVGVVTPC